MDDKHYVDNHKDDIHTENFQNGGASHQGDDHKNDDHKNDNQKNDDHKNDDHKNDNQKNDDHKNDSNNDDLDDSVYEEDSDSDSDYKEDSDSDSDDSDCSNISKSITPSSTVTAGLYDELQSIKDTISFLGPWPGSTYVIHSVDTGEVITLLRGSIVLNQLGGFGSQHWTCVEKKGCLGFHNAASGRFLGHDNTGRLCCQAEKPRRPEYFCARMTPNGGCVLLMMHFEGLSYVGLDPSGELAKIPKDGAEGMVWHFIRI